MSKLYGPRNYEDAVTGSPRKVSKHVMFDRQDEVIQYEQISPELVDEAWGSLSDSELVSCDSDEDPDVSLPDHGPPDSIPQIKRGYRPLPKLPPFILPKYLEGSMNTGTLSEESDRRDKREQPSEEFLQNNANLQDQLSSSRPSVETRVSAVLDQPDNFKPGHHRTPSRADSLSSLDSQNSVIESLGRSRSSPGQSSPEFDFSDTEVDNQLKSADLRRQESLLDSQRLPATELVSHSNLPVPKSSSERSFVDRRKALLDMLNANGNGGADEPVLVPPQDINTSSMDTRGDFGNADLSFDVPVSYLEYPDNEGYLTDVSETSSPQRSPLKPSYEEPGEDQSPIISSEENLEPKDSQVNSKSLSKSGSTQVGPIDGRWPIPELAAVLSPEVEQNAWGSGNREIEPEGDGVVSLQEEPYELENPEQRYQLQGVEMDSLKNNDIAEKEDLQADSDISRPEGSLSEPSSSKINPYNQPAGPLHADILGSSPETSFENSTPSQMVTGSTQKEMASELQDTDQVTRLEPQESSSKQEELLSHESLQKEVDPNTTMPSSEAPMRNEGRNQAVSQEDTKHASVEIPTPNLPLPSSSPFTIDDIRSPVHQTINEPVQKSPSLDSITEYSVPILDSDLSDLEAQPELEGSVDSRAQPSDNGSEENAGAVHASPSPSEDSLQMSSRSLDSPVSENAHESPLITPADVLEESKPEQELDSGLTSPSPLDYTSEQDKGNASEQTENDQTNSTLASLPQIRRPVNRALPVPGSNRTSTASLVTAASTLTQSSLDIGEIGDSFNSISKEIDRMWPSSTENRGSYQLHESSSMVIASAPPHVHTSTALHPLHDNGVAPSPSGFGQVPYQVPQKESTVSSFVNKPAYNPQKAAASTSTTEGSQSKQMSEVGLPDSSSKAMNQPNFSSDHNLYTKNERVQPIVPAAKQQLRGPRDIATGINPYKQRKSIQPTKQPYPTSQKDVHAVHSSGSEVPSSASRSMPRNDAFKHYLEKRRSQVPRLDEKGRLFVRVKKIHGLMIKDSPSSVTLTFDTGFHSITSPPLPVDTPLTHDYEVSILPLTTQMTLTARLYPFPNVNGAWRKSVGADGSFARSITRLEEVCRESQGHAHTKNLALLNEWDKDRAGCTVDMEMMWIPRVSPKDNLPRSLDAAVAAVQKARAGSNPIREGYLVQSGGDCAKSKRRKFVLDSSALIAQSSSEHHRPRALFNLEKATTVSCHGSLITINFQKDRKLELKAIDEEDAADWTSALKQVIRHPLSRPKWLSGLLYS